MSNRVREIFIHVGLPRTGTTFLQHGLRKISTKLVLVEKLYFFHTSQTRIILPADHPVGSKILISYEGYSQPRYFPKFSVLLNDLRRRYPSAEVRVLLSLRSQRAMIESLYTQRIKEGERYQDFSDFRRNHLSKYLEPDYLKLRDWFAGLVGGVGNLRVFYYEDLLAKGSRFYLDWVGDQIGLSQLKIPSLDHDGRALNRGLISLEQIKLVEQGKLSRWEAERVNRDREDDQGGGNLGLANDDQEEKWVYPLP